MQLDPTERDLRSQRFGAAWMQMVFVWTDDYSPEASWRLLDWCLTRGADEIGLAFLGPPYVPDTTWSEVDEMLAPFRSRVASAGDRWVLTAESAAALRTVFLDGLFTRTPGDTSIENPTVYRGGVPLLSVVTRDGEGVLHLRHDDVASLERSGLPHHERSRHM